MNNKIKYISGIRGISALQVIALHLITAVFPSAVYQETMDGSIHGLQNKLAVAPINLIYDGSVGVMMFLIISGFCIGLKFTDTKKDDITISELAAPFLKRYARLSPQVFISVIICWFTLTVGVNQTSNLAQITQSKWLDGFYQFDNSIGQAIYEGLIGTLVFGECNYNPILWTIKPLFWSSLLSVSVCLLIVGKGIKQRVVIYLFLAIALLPLHYYSPVIIGVAASDFYNNNQKKISSGLMFLLFVLGMFIASYPHAVNGTGTIYSVFPAIVIPNNIVINTNIFYHGLGACIIFIGILYCPVIQRILQLPTLDFLGKISFEIYVLAFPLQNTVFSYLYIRLYRGVGIVTAFIISSLIFLVIVIISAWMLNCCLGKCKKKIIAK